MAIYRADKQHGIAWITGGSTGIGRQFALDLAGEGWTVAITSRKEDPIEPVIEAAASLPGKILAFYCDVTDEPGMAATVDAIEKEAGPIVLALFNAGVYIPMHGEALDLANFRKTYEVNLFGVLHGLIPAVDRMRKRSRGHVVLMGSVTAYFGWPTLAAYGATKAALNNMADALRYDFREDEHPHPDHQSGFRRHAARQEKHPSDAGADARREGLAAHDEGGPVGRLRDDLPMAADLGPEIPARVAARAALFLHELHHSLARLSADAGAEARLARDASSGSSRACQFPSGKACAII
jgi:NAD(P)-dependent dehydrogenase (short-subunit alcohol dehydrogenase family)